VILDNVAGPAGQSLAVTAFAWDPEGEEMDYILEFGDGSNSTGIVPEDGEMSIAHAFSIPGNYTMNLTVSDGEQGSSMSSDATIIASGGNAPPSNIRIRPDPMKATPGTQVMFTISGKDLENDPVSLRLNFSDGTADWTMTFEETSAGFEVSVAHIFAIAGGYDLFLSASDGNNETVQVVLYSVVEEEAGGLSMALVLGIVIVVLVVAAVAILVLRRRRGQREEEEVRLP
jgi:PKD repeat protein